MAAAVLLLAALIGAGFLFNWFPSTSPRPIARANPTVPRPAPLVQPEPAPEPEPPPPHKIKLRPQPPSPPPPPRLEPPHYALSVYARDKFVRPASAISAGDTDFWVGDLVCHVVATGQLPKHARLRLIWYRDGQETDVTDFAIPGKAGIKVRYENKPEPGKYRVALLVNGRPAHSDTSFTITDGQL